MRDFEIWRYSTIATRPSKRGSTFGRLYVPDIEPVGALPYVLAGLLPNRDHNHDLMALIDDLPQNKTGSRSMVGVFAADPFLNSRRIASRLIAKGYTHVANVPPVGAYGSEFLTTLDSVYSGRDGERQALERMAELGLSVCPVAASKECLADALAFSPSILWIAPGFDMWQGGEIDSESLLALCRQAADQTNATIILMTAGTGISEEEARMAGAGGVLVD